MTSNEVVLAVVEALETEGVPYLLAGAYSVGVYGVPRSTKDADFVVQLRPEAVAALVARLGSGFQLEPQMSFETVTGTSRHIIRVADSQFLIELFCLSDDAHDIEQFVRKRKRPLLGRDVFYPTAEDVVITKLRWSRQGQRSKDTDDVRNLLAVQGDNLDWDYIYRWCDEHGTRELLDEIRQSIPKT
jgi:hypothetical protein